MFSFVVYKLNKMNVGIDGFLNNWCVCTISNENKIKINTYPNIEKALINISPSSLIFIDIPIGLSSKIIERKIDQKLREKLPKGKKSSVFSAPCREAVYAVNYIKAKELNKKILSKSISIQSWNINNKIKELDEYLINKNKQQFNIHESHPELCFTNLNNGTPLKYSKKTNEGVNERIAILKKTIKNIEDILEQNYLKYRSQKIKKDDILDAISLALSVKKWISNGRRKISQFPECDDKGLPLEIYY